MKIISPSKVQKNISILSDRENIYTVVKKWEPQTVIIPYFEWIEDYVEDLEMYANRYNLVKKFKNSVDSWLSDLVI